MHKSVLIAAFYSAVLFAAQSTPVVADSQTSAESNIGFVIYTKSLAPGTLNARWMYSTKYKGPGIATGGPKAGFVGRYHVRYFYDSGKFSDECLAMEWFRNRIDAKIVIEDYRRQYNEVRPHSSLAMLTPIEFKQKLLSTNHPEKAIT